jgi:AcrR family transcriptional regulator
MRIPSKPSLRKKPVQARARATVDAILQAATYILAKEGPRKLTTNRIAERAGVNIASVYQYFPNKVAILAQLQTLHRTRIQQLPSHISSSPQAQSNLRSLLRAVIEAVLKEHEDSADPNLGCANNLPGDKLDVDRSQSMEESWEDLVRPFTHGLPDAALAMFIARHAVHAVIHQTVSTCPGLLRNPMFADELIMLLERYLYRAVTQT